MLADFNKKGNRDFFNEKLLFKVVGVLLICFIVFMLFEDFKIYRKKQQLTNTINIYKQQIEDIKNSSLNLKNEIANSDSTDYLEKLGYEQFGQTRPGETEYMFVNSDKKVETIATKKSFWDRESWFGWLVSAFSWPVDQKPNK
jgi:cell division protein FtsB